MYDGQDGRGIRGASTLSTKLKTGEVSRMPLKPVIRGYMCLRSQVLTHLCNSIYIRSTGQEESNNKNHYLCFFHFGFSDSIASLHRISTPWRIISSLVA